jgi:hypothetical protein
MGDPVAVAVACATPTTDMEDERLLRASLVLFFKGNMF